jgi:hypothetical protein
MIIHWITWRTAPRLSGHSNKANGVPEVLENKSVAILKLIYLTQWKVSVYQQTSAGSVSLESCSGILLASCYTYELVTQIELIREYYNQFVGSNYLWFSSSLLLYLISLCCFFSYIWRKTAMMQKILCSKTTRVATFAEIVYVLTSFVMSTVEFRSLENFFNLVIIVSGINIEIMLQNGWRTYNIYHVILYFSIVS